MTDHNASPKRPSPKQLCDAIAMHMAAATEIDALAREHRRAAGRLLAQLRDTCPKSFKRACADSRTAQMLIQLAAGGCERKG